MVNGRLSVGRKVWPTDELPLTAVVGETKRDDGEITCLRGGGQVMTHHARGARRIWVTGRRQTTVDALAHLLDGHDAINATAVYDGSLRANRGSAPHVLVTYAEPDPQHVTAWAEAVRRHAPHVRVVLVCSEIRPDVLRAADATSASAVLAHDAEPEQLFDAVTQSSGISDPPAGRTARSEAWDPIHSLTSRETEVLGLLAAGLTNAQMAAALAISPHTVRSHVRSVTSKLGVRDRYEAGALAQQAGLLATEATA